jgi:hypothetical protein
MTFVDNLLMTFLVVCLRLKFCQIVIFKS